MGWISTDENPEGELHSWNEREDDFASVAFWYQTGKPTAAEPVPDAAARTLPNLESDVAAKDFADAAHHGPGECAVQDNLRSIRRDNSSTNRRRQPDAWVEIPFQVASVNREDCCWP